MDSKIVPNPQYLHLVEEPLRDFLEKVLPQISLDWWDKCVIPNLPNRQKGIPKKLSELDSAALIKVMDGNWYHISRASNMGNDIRNYVKESLSVRNRWQHAPAGGLPAGDVIRDLDTLSRLAKAVGAKDVIINKFSKESSRILGISSSPSSPPPLPPTPPTTVVIKGISVRVCKSKQETIQAFVQYLLHALLDNNLIPNDEIQNMLKKDYCVRTFGIQFPIIQNVESKIYDGAGYCRYWVRQRFGKNSQYWACSQWQKQLAGVYEANLKSWVKKI